MSAAVMEILTIHNRHTEEAKNFERQSLGKGYLTQNSRANPKNGRNH